MFNCYLHGWSSHHSSCPACSSVNTGTSSGGFIIFPEEYEAYRETNGPGLMVSLESAIKDRDEIIHELEGALRFVLSKEPNLFAECSDAEAVIQATKEALAKLEKWRGEK